MLSSLPVIPAGGGHFAAELWERAKSIPGWERWSFRSTDGGRAGSEFEASIESLLGAIYADFCRAQNVAAAQYDPNEQLLMGCNFNRNPMSACIAQLQGEQLVIHREFVLDADTRMLANEIRKAYHR